jgi:hypothetical protein
MRLSPEVKDETSKKQFFSFVAESEYLIPEK